LWDIEEKPLKRPTVFDCIILVQKARAFCCCKATWYTDYQHGLHEVNKDLSRNLNIVDNIRRLRMHGLALTGIWNINQRKVIATKT
jgi:hypothetical protein